MDKVLIPIPLFFFLLFGTHAYLCNGEELKASEAEASANLEQPVVGKTPATLEKKNHPYSAMILNFIKNYFTAVESSDLDSLLSQYAPEVDYYAWGKVTKDLIRQEKADYFARWPKVKLSLAGEVEMLPLPATDEHFVSYLVNFSVHNPARSEGVKRITGQARHVWHLRDSPDGLRIILEKQQVMYRQRHAS